MEHTKSREAEACSTLLLPRRRRLPARIAGSWLSHLGEMNGALALPRPAPFLLLLQLQTGKQSGGKFSSSRFGQIRGSMQVQRVTITCSIMKWGTCTRFDPSARRLQGRRGSAAANSFRTWFLIAPISMSRHPLTCTSFSFGHWIRSRSETGFSEGC